MMVLNNKSAMTHRGQTIFSKEEDKVHLSMTARGSMNHIIYTKLICNNHRLNFKELKKLRNLLKVNLQFCSIEM